ncbi:hypothetical protein AMTR_s03063p00006870 [Amborella trichopoda]|uniref:Uncharacterized protein n=1 Tax=Amborella trichopoda TaxID=13333 RepID=U5CU78_AMBTC|nr:hypothetical protein AMTR_s03063p00006870 [Amborella trichopoda]
MAALRVTFLDALDLDVPVTAPSVPFPDDIVKMTFSEWESGNAWGHLSLKAPSMLAVESHVSKGLPKTPSILVVESLDSSEEDLSPRSKN